MGIQIETNRGKKLFISSGNINAFREGLEKWMQITIAGTYEGPGVRDRF